MESQGTMASPTLNDRLYGPARCRIFLLLLWLVSLSTASSIVLDSNTAVTGLNSSFSAGRDCKAHPSDSWPSLNEWQELNRLVNNQLLRPAPAAAVCHREHPAYDPRACTRVREAWTDGETHTRHPTSTMFTNVNGYSCQIRELNRACTNDGFPQFVLNATSAQQIATAVRWARDHNVRVNVKSTGHDFLGRSTQPFSLSIWVHYLQRREYHPRSYKLAGCGMNIDGPAITAGGGTQMSNLVKHANRFDMAVISGSSKTVSVGGYVSGGGHSILSGRYGLAADSVLEMEMVTPAGEVVTANECQNTDLFWAVRGGGGGTWGVMTKVTLKAFPKPSVATWNGAISGPAGANSTWNAIAAFHRAWTTSGAPQGCTAYAIGNVWGEGRARLSVYCPGKGVNGAATMLEPVIRAVNSAGGGAARMHGTASIPGAPKINTKFSVPADLVATDISDVISSAAKYPGNGENKIIASWLYGQAELTSPNLKRALMDASDRESLMYQDFTGGPACHNPPFIRGGGNAVGPGWRRALVRPSAELQWAGDNDRKLAERRRAAMGFTQALARLNPNMGTYVNEANPDMEDIQSIFWGANYPKLLQIKRRIDPTGSFWCKQCVGGEEWEQSQQGQLCRRRS